MAWDSSPPTLQWVEAPETLGRDTEIVLSVEDEGKGLRSIEVVLVQSGNEHIIFSENYNVPWPWQAGVPRRSFALSPKELFGKNELSEKEFIVQVNVRDGGAFWLWDNQISQQRSFRLDLTPPNIEILSKQHYIRQGGSEAILYRLSEDAAISGVKVGNRVFRGFSLSKKDKKTYICLFALATEQSLKTTMVIWAQDAAGNRHETNFWIKALPGRLRKRNIRLSNSLMSRMVSKILRNTNSVDRKNSVLETFLEINGDLRRSNHRFFEEISRQSAGSLLWDQPFLQLSNSQVQSAFADRRSYYYKNKKVDQQTHLGFDLASLAQSPVESANDGLVVFADYLGIYGNTVFVDHGLGLLSLYGHLSSITVERGALVKRGDTLGHTGQTGLATGDHLHFSMVLQGVQVNPLEWWDPTWVEKHVLQKIQANGQ